MSVPIRSGATTDLLTVDAASKAARTTLYDHEGARISKNHGENEGATDHFLPSGGRNDGSYRFSRVDRIGSQAVALNNILLHEPFEGTTISVPSRWATTTTTFTQAQTAAGGLNLNNGNSNAAAAAVLHNTNKRFIKMQRCPLQAKFRARLGHITNSTMEIGFGAPASQTVPPTVGAFFQVTTAGVLQGVLTFNSVDTTTTDMAPSLPGGWQSNFYTYDIILDDDEVIFTVQNTATGQILAERKIGLAVTQTRLWDATHLPVYARLHNVSAPASAPAMILTSVDVVSLDAFMNKPWGQTQAGMGFGCEVLPTSFGQSINWGNSSAPASATLSNTAAGYTTLGGLFQFAAVAGAATDYALFGFTVPAPYTFVCTGIDIDAWNTGAAVATTPSLLIWGASPDQTAISLATATNRRIGLGAHSFPIGSVVGATADKSISRDFTNSPLVTNSGRIFVIMLRMPVGTATASQVIQGMVNVKGYFE